MLNIPVKNITCCFLTIAILCKLPDLHAQAPLQITATSSEYRKEIAANPEMKMIELKSIIPNIRYDLRYATTNNFMNRRMYPWRTRKTFLRAPAANALLDVQKELNAKGLGLKIFDAYRPYAVTVKFWELVKDERYVANPSKGSGHNRGIAVDLTIINLEDGKELDMGTGFDNFTDTAHHEFKSLSEEILKNRTLLRTTMEKHGFRKYDTEWWHYFLPGGDKYSVLDLPFKRL